MYSVSYTQNNMQSKLESSHYRNCIDFYEIDLSDGCDVGCIYCGLAKRKVDSKYYDVSSIIEGQTPNKGIYLSPNCDPFYGEAAEQSHKLLERFLPEGVPFLIITKSIIPDKTIRLMSKYPNLIIPKVSLARLDDELNKYVEPRAASASIRLDNMRKLTDAGLTVIGLLMPMYYGIDDSAEKLEMIISEFKKCGVSIIKASYVLIRKGNSPKDIYIINKMKEHPLLNDCLRKMTASIVPHIGSANTVPLEVRDTLYKKISDISSKHNIKFSACSVLDPEIFTISSNGYVRCKNVWIFRNTRGVNELQN